MEHDPVELVEPETRCPRTASSVDATRRVSLRLAGEDDVDDVLRRQGAARRDQSTIAIGPSNGAPRDPDLLGDLAVECIDQRLAGVHAATRKQPDIASALVVPAEQDAVAPAQERRDADPRLCGRSRGLGRQRPTSPIRRSRARLVPRSLSESSSTSSSRTLATSTTTSRPSSICMPGLDDERLRPSVLSRIRRTSPR